MVKERRMAYITGNQSGNLLEGTALFDTIYGRGGSDRLIAAGGSDTLSGGDGNDRLFGGDGNDVLYGHSRFGLNGSIRAESVGTGFEQPVYVTSAPSDANRLFVVEKTGQIKILDLFSRSTRTFLDIPEAELSTGGEQGLLGLAFHPNYPGNGKFYVYLVNADGDLEVRQYNRIAVNRADPDSGDVILTIPHPTNGNHNGGWMSFGPDGMLYIAVGDGGSASDPLNNAQNTDVLLGKMLRIDVRGDDFAGDAGRDYAIPDDNPFANSAGADEIWATGLRNPWRNSFDRETGDLYIADVGQNAWEEINFQLASSNGGENYGWVIREGDNDFDTTRPGNPPPTSPVLTDPILDYPHEGGPNGGFSVTGGYVYRGPGAGLQGAYFYADFVTDQIWSFRVVNGRAVDAINRTAQITEAGVDIGQIASFGEDGFGNLYVVSLRGEIFRLTPEQGAGDGADYLNGGSGRDPWWRRQ
jgi:glucose/arabinose dehydrogenase